MKSFFLIVIPFYRESVFVGQLLCNVFCRADISPCCKPLSLTATAMKLLLWPHIMQGFKKRFANIQSPNDCAYEARVKLIPVVIPLELVTSSAV